MDVELEDMEVAKAVGMTVMAKVVMVVPSVQVCLHCLFTFTKLFVYFLLHCFTTGQKKVKENPVASNVVKKATKRPIVWLEAVKENPDALNLAKKDTKSPIVQKEVCFS